MKAPASAANVSRMPISAADAISGKAVPMKRPAASAPRKAPSTAAAGRVSAAKSPTMTAAVRWSNPVSGCRNPSVKPSAPGPPG